MAFTLQMARLFTASRFWFLPACLLNACLSFPVLGQGFAAGELAKADLPTVRAYDVEFSEWDIGKLLQRIRRVGIRFPLEVQGELSGWLWIQRSAEGWFDFENYRVEGEVSSPRLEVESWIFHRAKVRFGYGADAWRVGTLGGEVGHIGQENSLGIVDLSFTLPSDETLTDPKQQPAPRAQLSAEIKNADLAALANALDLPLEFDSKEGRLTLEGKVAADQLRQLEAWDVQASLSVPWLQLLKNRFRDLLVNAELDQGAANVTARAYAEEGELRASAAWPQLSSAKEGVERAARYWPKSARIQMERLQLDSLVLGAGLPMLSGVVEGDWEFALHPEEEGNSRWSTVGNLSVERLILDALRVGDLQIKGEKEATRQQFQGEIRLDRGEGLLEADLMVNLVAQGPEITETAIESYELSGQLENFLLSNREFLELPQTYTLRATGDFLARGSPDNWFEFAELQLENSPLQIASQHLQVEQALLQATADQFRLPRFQITADGQRVLGSAVLRRDEQGEHRANLRIVDLAIDPWIDIYAPPALQSLGGQADLQLHLTKAADQPNWAMGWNGTIEGEIANLRWQGMSAGDLQFAGNVTPERLLAQANGNLLGGTISWKTELQPKQLDSPENQADPVQPEELPQSQSSVHLREIDMQQLIAALQAMNRAPDYGGSLNFDGQFTTVGKKLTEAAFSLEVPRFSYQRQPLLSQVTLSGTLRKQQLEIDRLQGLLAGGRVNVRGGGPFGETITFAVDLLNVELNRVMAVFNPALAEKLEGRLSYRGSLRASPDRASVAATGTAALQSASLYDIPLQRVFGILTARYDFMAGQLDLYSRDLHGEAFGGDLQGDASLQGATKLQLDSRLSLANGEMEQLSQALGFDGVVGQGRFDASANLASSDIAALDRLRGPVVLDFESGSPKSVPLLGNVAKFIPFEQLQSTQISGGLLRAQLGQGQARIQDFQVFSGGFFFAAKGSIGLVSSRLDMDAVLQTGGGWQQQIGTQTLRMLAPTLLPEIALISATADLIRNRTVFVHITGTTKRPVVQPRIVGTLGRAYVQNLFRSLIGYAPAATTAQEP